jgi:large-conductance mechanosensitive channel
MEMTICCNCGLCLVVCIIALSIIDVQLIFFSGVDNIGTVNIAADLLMLLLLAFIVWMIKKEYNKCKNNEEEKDETNDEVSGDVLPNTQPSRGGTANMTDNTPLIRSV